MLYIKFENLTQGLALIRCTMIRSYETTNNAEFFNPDFHILLCFSHKVICPLVCDNTEQILELLMLQVLLNTLAASQLNWIFDRLPISITLVIIQQLVFIQNKKTFCPLQKRQKKATSVSIQTYTCTCKKSYSHIYYYKTSFS